MKKLYTHLLLLSILIGTNQSFAQGKNRLQPGKYYEAGESLYAPRFGFNAKVPTGWQGSLPRESEVFLLQTITPDVFGEIYVFGREQSDLQALKKTSLEGVELSETIRIKAKDPVIKGDMLSSEVIGVGDAINKGNRGYIAARCNPDGPCVIALSIMPKQFYEPIKAALEQFLIASTFEPPSNASPHATLNWNEFLANKAFYTYAYVKDGSKDSEIHFCPDGTFSADIKKKGLLKNQNPQYQGKLSGTWVAKGIGENSTLLLEFKSKKGLPPLEIQLSIKDEQVFANNERYFVAQSTKCK